MKFKTNQSQPFVWVVILFAIGIIVVRYLNLSLGWLWIILAAGFILTLNSKRFLSTIGICLLLMCAGAIETVSFRQMPADDLVHVAKYYRQKPIRVRGVVDSDVEYRQFNRTLKTVFTLQVNEYEAPWGWKQQPGKLLVQYFGDEKIVYGDLLEIEGKLHKPFEFDESEAFSYTTYLNQRGIYRLLSVKKVTPVVILEQGRGHKWLESIYNLRAKLREILRTHLSFNEYGLMQAILLGDRSFIPKHIMVLFEHTGTVHIIAISGMNMTVIAGIFFIFIKILPIGRRAHYIGTIFLLLGYMVLVDGRPSVIRATLMAIVFLSSFLFEREGKPLNTLALAALVILLLNPFYLFDIGFQLSFICVLSIFLIWPPLGDYLKRIPFFKTKLGEMITFSLAIWIGSGPMIVYYFGLFIPINIISNLWVVPIFTLIMILGLGLMFVGLVFPLLASHFALCLKIVLNLMVAGVFIIEKVPGAYYQINNVNIWYIISYYLILLVVIGVVNTRRDQEREPASLIDKAKQLW